MCVSILEDLPDEILIEICLYLTSIDTCNAFGKLNCRLDRTITQFRRDFNCQYLTLSQFKQFSSEQLSYNIEYIRKLTLNSLHSFGQISLFNQSTAHYENLHDFLPSLEQISLVNFSNQDVDILPKILSIEKVFIDFDNQISLLNSTKTQIDHYFFCVPNSIKELRLCGSEEGLSLQHQVPVVVSPNLEKLTISLSILDDLILLFQRAPYLTKLHFELNRHHIDPPKQYASVNIMPKYLKDVHIYLKDKQLLSFEGLYVLLINIPTIEKLSLEIESTDQEYGDGYRWKELISDLPNLSQLYFGVKLWIGYGDVPIDVKPYLDTFIENSIDVCCYADTRVLFIDTIPYVYDNPIGILASPRASQAQSTNLNLFQRSPQRVNTLALDGRHQSSSIKDWLTVIQRFPRIQILDFTSVNISDELEETTPFFRFPNLTLLRYIRSTKCKVNLSFFLYLTNSNVTPRLRSLTIMYGDVIYLCKRLSDDLSFPQMKELCIFGYGADGMIHGKGIDLLLKYFPNLEYVWIHFQSSRMINKHAKSIIERFLLTLTNLINFRITCKKKSLQLPNSKWIEHLCQVDHPDKVKITIEKNYLTIWKR